MQTDSEQQTTIDALMDGYIHMISFAMGRLHAMGFSLENIRDVTDEVLQALDQPPEVQKAMLRDGMRQAGVI